MDDEIQRDMPAVQRFNCSGLVHPGESRGETERVYTWLGGAANAMCD